MEKSPSRNIELIKAQVALNKEFEEASKANQKKSNSYEQNKFKPSSKSKSAAQGKLGERMYKDYMVKQDLKER